MPHGQPILIKEGPPLHHGQPLLVRGPHKGGFAGHAPMPEEPAVIFKGHFGMSHGGHGPLMQGQPIILKNVHPPPPMVHGAPLIIRGGPLVKGGGHTVQGPTILLRGGGAHGFKGGPPIVLKGGFASPVPASGLEHEQHAVAGPSYLITTVHHVQKVSGGGKLLASFGGARHAKSSPPPIAFAHGPHVVQKGW
ncbi:uncharacterized protein LOC100900746 [Galendromus occidentalis]|uniref:Uncharacterized protein LOC100900746 n=1 Tax=Galendromus occidentalis TaxID=34638 RepID=A0AAJ6QXE9_9ACAR|nr:uncharacterized protein LOC100900746 [Galendromus occidentalis]